MVALIAEDDVSDVPMDDANDPSGPGYVAGFEAIITDPNQMLIIAEREGKPIGTLQITFLPGIARKGMWRGLIESVHIIPPERNKGHGGRMIQWAVEQCRDRGCGMVQLTSNKKRVDAHRFYQRLGFDQSHEGFKLFL
jgi:GNAT superfamily N-acetyltransferase